MVIVKSFYPLERDSRLIKLLNMVEKEDYRITYLGWNRKGTTCFSYKQKEFEHYRSIVMQSNVPFGLRSFPFLPFWWFFVLMWLLRLEWDVVHVVNFPSIMPAVMAARLKNKPIVYDVEDTYVDQLSALPYFLRFFGIQIERLCMKLVSGVILVDEMQVEEFGGIPSANFVVVYDSPPLLFFDLGETAPEKDFFKIFYAGYLNRSRHLNIEPLIEATRSIEGVRLIFAGEGDLVEEIKTKALEMPDKIQYVGWIPYHKVLEMSYEADLLFSLRNANPPVQKYICGSKLLEATMCGKPILVNKGTSTAIKVIRNKCGVVVDANNVEEIKETILRLKNDQKLCRKLGINGKKAYENIYDWKIMKRRLLSLYSEILNKG